MTTELLKLTTPPLAPGIYARHTSLPAQQNALWKPDIMLFAIRNAQGQISSLSANPVDNSMPVDIQDPEVILFLSRNNETNTPLEFLEKSDNETSRIIEDLIDLLVMKNTILFTDLPEAAQQKLLTRKLARSAYSTSSDRPSTGNSILTDDETL